jgi:hypothetical protein
MKIALALSGLARLYTISAASWGRIIGKYDTDVYVHSWCDPILEPYIRDQLGWVFKPTDMLLQPPIDIDVSPYPDRHWPHINVDRSLSMWHGICAAHKMVRSSDIDYDIIIRGRMDLHIHRLDLIEFDGIVLLHDQDKVPLQFNYRGIPMHGFNDHFAYGPPHYMDQYAKTLEEIPSLYANEGVDYCPENFLAANLIKQHVPVMLQHAEHCLIRR